MAARSLKGITVEIDSSIRPAVRPEKSRSVCSQSVLYELRLYHALCQNGWKNWSQKLKRQLAETGEKMRADRSSCRLME